MTTTTFCPRATRARRTPGRPWITLSIIIEANPLEAAKKGKKGLASRNRGKFPDTTPFRHAPGLGSCGAHTSQTAMRIPSPACWGRWRGASDGAWPAATAPKRLARTLPRTRSPSALLSTPRPSPSATPSLPGLGPGDCGEGGEGPRRLRPPKRTGVRAE
jgi:hypothetical protein